MKSIKSKQRRTNLTNEYKSNPLLIDTIPIRSMNLFNEECTEYLNDELERTSHLNLPDCIHIIDSNLQPINEVTDIFNVRESLSLLIQQDELTHKIYLECFDELVSNGSCPELANNLLNKIFVSHQINRSTLFNLAESTGRHNKHYEQKAAADMGKRRSLLETEKAKKVYLNKYEKSMEIMRDILLSFYSDKLNLGYKLQTVLTQIEILLTKNGIPFPDTKLKRSKFFQRYLDIVMMSLPNTINYKGMPNKGFRTIDNSSFEKEYNIFIKDC